MTIDENSGMIDQPSAHMRLAAELAVGLARRLWMALGPEATDAGFCWTHFQNAYLEGCYVLWELGAALAGTEFGESEYGPLPGDQGMTWQQYAVYAKQHPGDHPQQWFKFFPASETRACVLAHGELPDALFGRLLAAYVGNACMFGPGGTQLCSDQEPFKPAVEFEREIAALVACGYAERCGDMVKWADKIASAMHAEHCWDDTNPRIKALPHDVLERVNMLVHDHNPIAAIALVREETGADLVECKAYVDDLVRKSHRMPLHRPRG